MVLAARADAAPLCGGLGWSAQAVGRRILRECVPAAAFVAFHRLRKATPASPGPCGSGDAFILRRQRGGASRGGGERAATAQLHSAGRRGVRQSVSRGVRADRRLGCVCGSSLFAQPTREKTTLPVLCLFGPRPG